MIGKLHSIFSEAMRGGDDSTIPGQGNPAASRVVKDYLAAMRVEQLEARIVPTQADPIFISDLAAIAAFIGQQVNENVLSATQFFVLIRDQSLSSRETERVILERSRLRNCCTSSRDALLFNHVLTKSLFCPTSNFFSLKRYRGDPSLCLVTALEV